MRCLTSAGHAWAQECQIPGRRSASAPARRRRRGSPGAGSGGRRGVEVPSNGFGSSSPGAAVPPAAAAAAAAEGSQSDACGPRKGAAPGGSRKAGMPLNAVDSLAIEGPPLGVLLGRGRRCPVGVPHTGSACSSCPRQACKTACQRRANLRTSAALSNVSQG